jgi:hypothetical protein
MLLCTNLTVYVVLYVCESVSHAPKEGLAGLWIFWKRVLKRKFGAKSG